MVQRPHVPPPGGDGGWRPEDQVLRGVWGRRRGTGNLSSLRWWGLGSGGDGGGTSTAGEKPEETGGIWFSQNWISGDCGSAKWRGSRSRLGSLSFSAEGKLEGSGRSSGTPEGVHCALAETEQRGPGVGESRARSQGEAWVGERARESPAL